MFWKREFTHTRARSNESVWAWPHREVSNSVLFDMVSGRLLHPSELLLLQGFPVPGHVCPDLAERFPFPDGWMSTLTVSGRRKLLGNSMHVAAVGAALLFLVAGTEKNLDEVA